MVGTWNFIVSDLSIIDGDWFFFIVSCVIVDKSIGDIILILTSSEGNIRVEVDNCGILLLLIIIIQAIMRMVRDIVLDIFVDDWFIYWWCWGFNQKGVDIQSGRILQIVSTREREMDMYKILLKDVMDVNSKVTLVYICNLHIYTG